MKIIILKNNLLEGLNSVEKSISDSSNLPILKNVLLKVEDNKITLTSTNLELAIKHYVSGKIIEKGEVTIPFNVLSGIVKNLNVERVDLESKERDLLVKTDNYEALVQGQDVNDFPIIPSISNKEVFLNLKTETLKQALSQVIVATQYSDIRPEISGVYLACQNNYLKLVATDSFRLAEKTLNQDQFKSTLEDFEIIIPFKTAQEVLKIITDSEVKIFIDPNQVLFRTDAQEITSRLISSRFPDYQAILPKETKTEVVLNRQDFINALKLTSVFAGRANDIVLKVGENKKNLELFSHDSRIGQNRYLIPVKIRGDKFGTAFNWRYLLDGLRIYNSEELILGVNSPDRPVLIKSLSETTLIYILMPIKT